MLRASPLRFGAGSCPLGLGRSGLRVSPKTINLIQPAMPLLIPLAAYMAPPTPANPRVLTRGTYRPSLTPDSKRLSRRRSRAEWSGRSAPYRNSEEAPRGVERRAERHAATRFVGCAAEHVARLGGCIQPTKHRDAKRREGDGSGETCRALTGKDRCKQIRCRLRPERD